MSKTTAILNNLIQILHDGQEGYRAASEDVDSTSLKTLFSGYSLQRSQFAGELQSLAHSLGEDEPETGGSLKGTLHRGWLDLKAALTSKDEHAILSECDRGEDAAVAAYDEALEQERLPDHVLETLNEQYEELLAAHDRIRHLRDFLVAK